MITECWKCWCSDHRKEGSGLQVLTTHNNNITIITSAQTPTQFRNAHTIKWGVGFNGKKNMKKNKLGLSSRVAIIAH